MKYRVNWQITSTGKWKKFVSTDLSTALRQFNEVQFKQGILNASIEKFKDNKWVFLT